MEEGHDRSQELAPLDAAAFTAEVRRIGNDGFRTGAGGACVLDAVRSVSVDRAMRLTFVIDNNRQVVTPPRSFSRIRRALGQHRSQLAMDNNRITAGQHPRANESRLNEDVIHNHSAPD